MLYPVEYKYDAGKGAMKMNIQRADSLSELVEQVRSLEPFLDSLGYRPLVNPDALPLGIRFDGSRSRPAVRRSGEMFPPSSPFPPSAALSVSEAMSTGRSSKRALLQRTKETLLTRNSASVRRQDHRGFRSHRDITDMKTRHLETEAKRYSATSSRTHPSGSSKFPWTVNISRRTRARRSSLV